MCDLDAASTSLKMQLLNNYGKWIISKGFQDEQGCSIREVEEQISAFVELVLADEMNWVNVGTDKLYHMKLLEAVQKPIKTNDILQQSDDIVICNGIAGIGKSTLLYYLATCWSDNRIWNNKIGSSSTDVDSEVWFDFVFIFEFRRLNSLSEIDSLEALLVSQYPCVFDLITFKELSNSAKTVLIILDGADEFAYMNDVRSLENGYVNDVKIARAVYDLFNSPDSGLNHKLLISGRPEASRDLLNLFKNKAVTTKRIEVIGFSLSSVDLFIRKSCKKDKHTYTNIRRAIDRSSNIAAMAAIPFFLSIICLLFREYPTVSAPATMTELYVWAIILFLKNHCRHKQISTLSVDEIILNKDVHIILRNAFKLAYKAQYFKEIIFSRVDANEELLLSSGLLTKVYLDGLEVKYQFKHLSYQEFLAAAYIFDEDIERLVSQ